MVWTLNLCSCRAARLIRTNACLYFYTQIALSMASNLTAMASNLIARTRMTIIQRSKPEMLPFVGARCSRKCSLMLSPRQMQGIVSLEGSIERFQLHYAPLCAKARKDLHEHTPGTARGSFRCFVYLLAPSDLLCFVFSLDLHSSFAFVSSFDLQTFASFFFLLTFGHVLKLFLRLFYSILNGMCFLFFGPSDLFFCYFSFSFILRTSRPPKVISCHFKYVSSFLNI